MGTTSVTNVASPDPARGNGVGARVKPDRGLCQEGAIAIAIADRVRSALTSVGRSAASPCRSGP